MSWTVLDSAELYWTIQDHSGPYWTALDRNGPYWTVLDCIWSCLAVCGHTLVKLGQPWMTHLS